MDLLTSDYPACIVLQCMDLLNLPACIDDDFFPFEQNDYPDINVLN
jgi:hypothetical protein